jgi:lipopolysaccharide export system protein LptC
MNRVITAKADAQTARAYWTMSSVDTERVFRSARRHSRFVRVFRVAIPIFVLFGLGITVGVTYFNPLRMLAKLPIDLDKLVVSGTKITMENPRVSGFTKDGRAYDLVAVAAHQDLTKPDIVELQSLHAKLQMEDKSIIQLVADTGIYNAKAEMLELQKNIVLSNPSYEGRLSQATVDVRSGHVVSNEPVKLKMIQGTLDANHMEISDSGNLVLFTGGVDMLLKLPPPEGQEASAK